MRMFDNLMSRHQCSEVGVFVFAADNPAVLVAELADISKPHHQAFRLESVPGAEIDREPIPFPHPHDQGADTDHLCF